VAKAVPSKKILVVLLAIALLSAYNLPIENPPPGSITAAFETAFACARHIITPSETSTLDILL